jgi:hypothetical protein
MFASRPGAAMFRQPILDLVRQLGATDADLEQVERMLWVMDAEPTMVLPAASAIVAPSAAQPAPSLGSSGIGPWVDHTIYLPQPYVGYTVTSYDIGVPSRDWNNGYYTTTNE